MGKKGKGRRKGNKKQKGKGKEDKEGKVKEREAMTGLRNQNLCLKNMIFQIQKV